MITEVKAKQVLYQICINTLDVDCNEDVRATEYIFMFKERAEEFVINTMEEKLGDKYGEYFIEEVYLIE